MRLSFLLLLVLLTKSSRASDNGLSDELRFIHQEIGALRDENHKQNMEIVSLKETVQLQNKTINQHEATIKDLFTDDHKMIRTGHPVSSAAMARRKRPARLLPASILRGKKKNQTDEDHRKTFYGPPTNCSDLTRLGYTLNGFYMIKRPTNDTKIAHDVTILDVVYCTFKQEGTFDASLVERLVMPFPFTAPLMPMPDFHSFINPLDEDVYFWFTAVRNKKDHSGVLTFDSTQLNKGNGFDGKTGNFKAPKFGIYHFLYEATSFERRENGTNVDIYLNDALVGNPVSFTSQDLKKMSLQVTLKLTVGDSVFFKATSLKNNSDPFLTVLDVVTETVMGFLVKATLAF